MRIFGSSPMKTGNMCMKYGAAQRQTSPTEKETGSWSEETQSKGLRNLIIMTIFEQITA